MQTLDQGYGSALAGVENSVIYKRAPRTNGAQQTLKLVGNLAKTLKAKRCRRTLDAVDAAEDPIYQFTSDFGLRRFLA